MRHFKLVLVAALALLALSAAASTATAASFSISPGGPVTARSLGLFSFSSNVTRVTCVVELIGSLNRELINKVTGAIFGRVTRGIVSPCNREGSGIIQETSLPWDLQYNSILGTLPDAVTGLLFRVTNRDAVPGAGFILEVGVRCLFRGPVNALGTTARTGGGGGAPAIYSVGLLRTGLNTIPLFEGGIFCPRTGSLQGSFGFTPAQRVIRLPG